MYKKSGNKMGMKSHSPRHPATAKGGKANMGDVKQCVKMGMQYSKSYGTIGGKKSPQK